MAAKLKLTPEVQDTIVTYLRCGAYIETAVEAAGIVKETYFEWLRLARTGKEPYASFEAATRQAMAQAELTALQRIDSAGQWQADAWRLERRFPAHWGRVQRALEAEASAGGLKVVVRVTGDGDDGGDPPVDADPTAE